MPLPIIQVRNLSKRYRIGLKEKRHDTFTAQLLHNIKAPLRNLRQLRSLSRFNEEDDSVFWALKDIDFDVQQGKCWASSGITAQGKAPC
ncbi:MAG: hypothetical protein H6564_21020 [Lewinellaceae bacterium]|nr:hypothetical protein [Lewinellaceae bacterium]